MIELAKYTLEVLRKDAEAVLSRGQREEISSGVLVLSPAEEYPAPEILKWLEHAYSLKEALDRMWAARPIAIVRNGDRMALVLEDPGGMPLDQLLDEPLELELWLRLAIGLSIAINQLHQRRYRRSKCGPTNKRSAWDKNLVVSFGGVDDPVRRRGYEPAGFRPLQNPFYVALPYCDMQAGRLKPEAAKVVPWFVEQFSGSGSSVCKGHWLEARNGAKICYAKWEDVGPFCTDSVGYVFGDKRPPRT